MYRKFKESIKTHENKHTIRDAKTPRLESIQSEKKIPEAVKTCVTSAKPMCMV